MVIEGKPMLVFIFVDRVVIYLLMYIHCVQGNNAYLII